MVAIAITRMDLTAAGLRASSARSPDAQAARRMLALALVLDAAHYLAFPSHVSGDLLTETFHAHTGAPGQTASCGWVGKINRRYCSYLRAVNG